VDQTLRDFAHAIASGPTRAVVNRKAGSLTVFVEGGPVEPGAVVVVQLKSQTGFVTGTLTRPAPGWVQIEDTAYPASRVAVRGPVLFTVHRLERGVEDDRH